MRDPNCVLCNMLPFDACDFHADARFSEQHRKSACKWLYSQGINCYADADREDIECGIAFHYPGGIDQFMRDQRAPTANGS